MVRKVLHILLVASIFACPLWCRGGTCASTDGCCHSKDCATECCSPQRCPNDQDGHEDQPSDDSQPSNDLPQGVCQCICGGAINDRSDDSLAPPSSNRMDAAAAAIDSMVTIGASQFSRAVAPAEGCVLPRCNLFILNMSMLL
jgi:hypothetical protein